MMTDMSDAGNQDAGLLAHARARPDHVALRQGDEVRTYGHLDDRARRVAHALARIGVGRGDRVAVIVPNSFEFFEAVHGAGRLGAVVVPVNIHFKADEAGWIIADSGAAAAVVAGDLQRALDGVTDVPRLVVGPGGDYEAALASAPDQGEVEPPEIVGDGWPTVMAYTSGTTGRPKGVAIGEDDFRRRAVGVAASKDRWGFSTDDVHLLVGPSYHMGPMFWAQMHLAFGASVVIMPKWDPRGALELIERWRVTNTGNAPVTAAGSSSSPRTSAASATCRRSRSSCRGAMPGAAQARHGVRRHREGLGVLQARPRAAAPSSARRSGSSTPAAWASRSPGTSSRSSTTTATRCARGSRHDLRQTGGVELRVPQRPRQDGFVASRPMVHGRRRRLSGQGRLPLPHRPQERHGDLGRREHLPTRIEDCLHQHPDVVDCAVLGVPDDRWGEILYAVVQPRAAASLDADAVITWCRDNLADYKRPRVVEFVDELPRDPNGKVRKPKLREAWLAQQQG